MMNVSNFAVFGSVVTCPSFGSVVIEENSLVIVVDGRIADVLVGEQGINDALQQYGISPDNIVRLKVARVL